LLGVSDDIVQVLLKSALVVDQRFGITNDIDEQDVTYSGSGGISTFFFPSPSTTCHAISSRRSFSEGGSLARRRKGERASCSLNSQLLRPISTR